MERLGLAQIARPSEEGYNRHGFVYGRQVAIRRNAPFPLNTMFHNRCTSYSATAAPDIPDGPSYRLRNHHAQANELRRITTGTNTR
ncbi:hypothetical protein [Tessaracoccus antarcticus]|uniref:Uncharacterized protein n=1 Tax=Tessaracoccus antarcticus TaxID=2479848 RepID=A0A3M0GBW0_9ACTN|nr:hypothetical protein [Tessaracoccus antarcticus]RMB62310.1 hypothetical protein EAX62_07075 [Tessaracoccus antarcticus]